MKWHYCKDEMPEKEVYLFFGHVQGSYKYGYYTYNSREDKCYWKEAFDTTHHELGKIDCWAYPNEHEALKELADACQDVIKFFEFINYKKSDTIKELYNKLRTALGHAFINKVI